MERRTCDGHLLDRVPLGGKSTLRFFCRDQTYAFQVRGVDHEATLAATFGLVPIDAGLSVLDLRHQRFPSHSRIWSLMRPKAVTARADPSSLIARGYFDD
jgi:hypothetical protein